MQTQQKSYEFKESRTCPNCGYSTRHRGHWSTHRKTCKNRPTEPDVEKEQLRQRISADADRIQSLEHQLASKDKQINELLKAAREERKRPRTVNNKNYNVNQQINVFGKESLAHLTETTLQDLLSDPDTSVARLVTLKHSVEENQNLRVPNRREKWVQVLKQTSDGKKVWEVVPKHDILTELVETNAMFLEGEADESTAPGLRFSQWHERLLQSQDSGGKMFREQMDMVHNTLVESTRH